MNSQLKIIDYLVLLLTLLSYVVIGIYFGCFGSKQKSTREYMYGKGQLTALPIGLSIFSSSLSGVAMLGIPSEIYVFGIQFMFHVLGAFLSLLITCNFILPVFNGTQSFKAPYEYYEHRFNKSIRIFSSLIYALQASFLVPIILYSCSLLISDAIGINVIVCSTIIGGICVIYTMMGGFVTVIWTDVLQAIIMFVTLISLGIVSVIKAGGFETIWINAEKGGRIFFDFDPNPFKRLTVWSVILGTMTNFVGHQGSSASTLQRYLSVRTEKEARKAIFIGATGFTINTIIGTIIGLSMFSMYIGCDPIANHELKNYNQLTSYYALNIVQHIPGLTGILIAGLLSAGLSSMSSDLNTISGIIYYDFIRDKFKRFSNDSRNGAYAMKFLVLIFGIYYVLMVYVVQKVKYLIPMTITVSGTAGGLKLGLLILGTVFPKANSKGVLCGIITAGVIISWIAINATIYNVGSLAELPVSTDNCSTFWNKTKDFNQTISVLSPSSIKELTKAEPLFIYKLSFLYYNFFGTFITISVALLVSYATGVNDYENMDPKLFIPWVRPKRVIQQDVPELENLCKKR